MDINDAFCPKCGMLKSRCRCSRNLFLKQCSDPKLKRLFDLRDEIVTYKCLEPFNPNPTIPVESSNLSKKLVKALKKRGITKLYEFQVEAVNTIKNGKNVVITAPTGFGKTEAFILPIIDVISKSGKKVIILYPTKALAKDQLDKISYYSSFSGVKTVKFDGDSTYIERRLVFSGSADIILTNPDMVDYHLRNTPSFREIIEDLAFLVVDEFHTYTSVMGTNLHYLHERLTRFSDYNVVCSSATIANPAEFAEELFERKFVHVHGEHRKSKMHFLMLLTPSIYSSIKEIVIRLLKSGYKILVFGNSYKFVETSAWILKREGVNVRVHKGGLPKEVREKVEKEFKSGKLNVVVSTSTLELGIDIGDVDAVITELVNYSTFLQRAGRAGRKGQECVGILLMRDENAISQYYKRNPEDYFKDELYCYLEKMNEDVMFYQLLSMCIEKPLDLVEIKDEWMKVVELLVDNGFAKFVGRKLVPLRIDIMKNFSMRGIGETVKIIRKDTGKVIGERTLPIAIKELFPGGIIIHGGIKYECVNLDLEKRIAEVELCERERINEITDPLYTSIPSIIHIHEFSADLSSAYCTLEINMTVYGYVVKDVFSGKKLRSEVIEPVSYKFPTKGFLLSVPFPDYMDYKDFYAGSFHALEHVLIEASDALTGGGSNHMGGISTPDGDIFVYDGVKGGSGLSKLLFKRLDKAFRIAYDVLKNCECKRVEGCPRCTYSYQCGNNNKPLNRLGALMCAEKYIKGERRKVDPEKYLEVRDFKYYP